MRRIFWFFGALVMGCHDAEQAPVPPDARACVSSTAFTGLWPVAIATADINGDHTVDMVTANRGGNSVSVMTGNGDGTFEAATNIFIGGDGNAVVVGDFNGDAKPDIAFAVDVYGKGAVGVMLGNGDATFGPLVPHPNDGRPLQALALAAGTFTSGGALDLVATVGGFAVDPLLGNGDGTFRHTMYVGTGAVPVSVVVADLDGDGNQDIVVGDGGSLCIFNCDNPGAPSSTPGSVEVVLGHGDGTFGAPSFVDHDIYVNAVATADVNGDGRFDIVATAFGPTSVYIGNGDGTFQRGALLPDQDYGAVSIAVADLDGDGVQDLAEGFSEWSSSSVTPSGSVTNTLGLRHGNGDGTFDPPVLYAVGPPQQIAIADVDGNGLADVLVVNGGDNSVSVLLDGCFR